MMEKNTFLKIFILFIVLYVFFAFFGPTVLDSDLVTNIDFLAPLAFGCFYIFLIATKRLKPLNE